MTPRARLKIGIPILSRARVEIYGFSKLTGYDHGRLAHTVYKRSAKAPRAARATAHRVMQARPNNWSARPSDVALSNVVSPFCRKATVFRDAKGSQRVINVARIDAQCVLTNDLKSSPLGARHESVLPQENFQTAGSTTNDLFLLRHISMRAP